MSYEVRWSLGPQNQGSFATDSPSEAEAVFLTQARNIDQHPKRGWWVSLSAPPVVVRFHPPFRPLDGPVFRRSA